MSNRMRTFIFTAVFGFAVVVITAGLDIAQAQSSPAQRAWPIGFGSGYISSVEWIDAPSAPMLRRALSDGQRDQYSIDLNMMAQRALKAVLKSLVPVPGGNWYRPTGWNNAFACPMALGFETSEYAEQSGRCGLALYWLRRATGSHEGQEREEAMYALVAHHIRNGLPSLPTMEAHIAFLRGQFPNITDENDLPHEFELGFNVPHPMEVWVLRYADTRDEKLRRLIEAAVTTLKQIAIYDSTGYAFYPCAFFTFDAAGRPQWNTSSWLFPYTAACSLNPLALWAQISGDADDMAFVRALADGVLAGLSCEDPQLRRGGLFPTALYKGKGHYHSLAMMTRARGMILAGITTGERSYINWGKGYYDIMLRQNSDSGWFGEHFPSSGDRLVQLGKGTEPRPHNETCVTADMLDIAALLARNGYPDYWDHVERYVRNYLAVNQLTLDEKFDTLYRQVNAGKKPQEIEKSLALAKAQWVGAFPGIVRINDLVLGIDKPVVLDMEGCCNWGGSRAVGRARAEVVTTKGNATYINMAFDCSTPRCDVVSYLPAQGQVTVVPKHNGDFYLRPPAWVPSSKVRAFKNGKPINIHWEDAYVQFSNAKIGQPLTITYPLVHFVQSITLIGTGKPYEFKLEWLGNTVVDITPKGQWLPLYEDRQGILECY